VTAQDKSIKLQPHISTPTVHSFTDHSWASNMKFKMATYVQWVYLRRCKVHGFMATRACGDTSGDYVRFWFYNST